MEEGKIQHRLSGAQKEIWEEMWLNMSIACNICDNCLGNTVWADYFPRKEILDMKAIKI